MKTILVTGATGYFGKYFVEGLKNSFRIVAVARDRQKLETLFPSADVRKEIVDFSNLSAVTAFSQKIFQEEPVFGLINNAYDFSKEVGFNSESGRLEQIALEKVESSVRSGLLAPMALIQEMGNQLRNRGESGSIINISSMYGTVAPDPQLYENRSTLNPVSYGMVKAGLDALTRYTASFWGQHGIRCNSIAPGAFPNVETDSANAPKDSELIKILENKTALGRVGHPKDLLGMVKLLLSDEGAYITGQTLAVDGGWTVT